MTVETKVEEVDIVVPPVSENERKFTDLALGKPVFFPTTDGVGSLLFFAHARATATGMYLNVAGLPTWFGKYFIVSMRKFVDK